MSLNLIEGQDRTDLASVNDLPWKLGPDPHGHLDAAAAVVTHLDRVTGRHRASHKGVLVHYLILKSCRLPVPLFPYSFFWVTCLKENSYQEQY